jgi:hypothetical protein
MTRRPAHLGAPTQLGATFRIDYANPKRWRSQAAGYDIQSRTPPPGGMRYLYAALGVDLGTFDPSILAPIIEAGGQVAASTITAVSEAERQRKEEEKQAKQEKASKKKSKKKGKSKKKDSSASAPSTEETEDTESAPLPWGPILLGGAAVTVAAFLLLRKKPRGTLSAGANRENTDAP